MVATAMDSSTEGGGSNCTRRLASMVLPVPGGPVMSRWWPPAAAIESARLAWLWPRTSFSESPSFGCGGRLGSSSAGAGNSSASSNCTTSPR